ncbi:protein DpdG [Massilia sp. 2TAF26]|uniref:protein DpdG n=1 Tax=Massilia sp. 2TAF26 TaxID=3233012 RepID=UPI003F952FC2
MTILNLASDGLHPQVIVLASVLAKQGPTDRDELISVCSVPDDVGRMRAALARWLELGLFTEEAGTIKLNLDIKRGAALDDTIDRLPGVCRQMLLQDQHCLPLWGPGAEPTEVGVGRVSDFARGIAWALAQDIYNLPEAAEKIEALEGSQVTAPRNIFLNRTRWPGLRMWARYLGFGSGPDNNFLFDPTEVVRQELPHILGKDETMTAQVFLDQLSARVPVLDGGSYRNQIEMSLKTDTWRKPPTGHLSMSLSIALRRLHLNGTIVLELRADAGTGNVIGLTGRNYRSWASFSHVRMIGEPA